MKPENLKKLEETIEAMDTMYESELKPYMNYPLVREAGSKIIHLMNELIAIYNDEGGDK